MLADEIKDYVQQGVAVLYRQKESFDAIGTVYLLKVTDTLVFRLNRDGNFILPPLNGMPSNADLTDIVELLRD
jgi:hypothetical protein